MTKYVLSSMMNLIRKILSFMNIYIYFFQILGVDEINDEYYDCDHYYTKYHNINREEYSYKLFSSNNEL